MMNKIMNNKNKFEKAKNDTKKLIEGVREYLTGKTSSFLLQFLFSLFSNKCLVQSLKSLHF